MTCLSAASLLHMPILDTAQRAILLISGPMDAEQLAC
jgi:hypothetical protein